MESKGQKIDEWANLWKGLTPESEIQMWDYYGLRPWILKYTPRFGKVNVCSNCLRLLEVNLKLCNENIKPIFRNRR